MVKYDGNRPNWQKAMSNSKPTGSNTLNTSTDDYRRAVVGLLRDQEDPITVRELARLLAARERETGIGGITESTVTDIAFRLHRHYLPPLERDGVINYDDGRVSVRERACRS